MTLPRINLACPVRSPARLSPRPTPGRLDERMKFQIPLSVEPAAGGPPALRFQGGRP
jgi:hypothetical protein